MARQPWRSAHGAGRRQSLVVFGGDLGGGRDGGARHHRGNGGRGGLRDCDRRRRLRRHLEVVGVGPLGAVARGLGVVVVCKGHICM